MPYDNDYRNRSSAKKHFTRLYSQEELDYIKTLIKNYFVSTSSNDILNSNEAYFIPLSDAINESLYKGKDVIKPGYLCDVYNDKTNEKKKSIEKITAIKEFLEDYLGISKKEKNQLSTNENGILNDWDAATNTSTPQWADYIALPLKNRILNRVSCNILTNSEFYRVGFKFIRTDGKLFGDGSIQSTQDNNFVIHVAKNFKETELFITVYKNGIRAIPDKYIGIIPKENGYSCELYIDEENIIHFLINNKEVYRDLINKEIRNRVYMLAWGDGNQYEVKVKNIVIEGVSV